MTMWRPAGTACRSPSGSRGTPWPGGAGRWRGPWRHRGEERTRSLAQACPAASATGCVRVPGSTQSTSARSELRPHRGLMSRTLSTNSGSRVPERCGAEGRPYPPARVRQPALPGHRTERPVGRVGRRRLQRRLDDRGHDGRGSSDNALLQEAAAPRRRVLVAEFDCQGSAQRRIMRQRSDSERAIEPDAIRPAQNQDRIGRPTPRAIGKTSQIQVRWLLAIYFKSR